MRTPRIFSLVLLAAVVTVSGCKMPSLQILQSKRNLGNGRLFKFRDVGFKHRRLCPFKRFRSPQQPAYEPLVCESCLQDAPDLSGGTCESCLQNGFHDSSFSQNRLHPSYAQPYDQSQVQDTLRSAIQAPRELQLQAPRELPLQAPAESLNIFRNTPAPATVPAPLTAPELLNESTNLRGGFQPQVPTLRSKPEVDVVMQRAERARKARLAAEAEANAIAEEAEAKVATTLPPVQPKEPAKDVEEILPSVKNLADATESKFEEEADDDFVAPAEIEEKATDIVSEPTPIKTPEVAKPESKFEPKPVVDVKPMRSEKEVVEELRNSTVPHAVVFDSSPIIPEQRIQKLTPPEPKVSDKVVLRARPVQSFQFDSSPTTAIAESTRIAPPPTIQATTLRPSQYYDRSQVAERTTQPTRMVVDSPVEKRNRVPAVQASMKRPVLVAEVLKRPEFTIEPLPTQSEVLMSPEGIPLDQISKEPTLFRSLPVSDQMTEPASVYLENSTTERVRPQTQPEVQERVQPETQLETQPEVQLEVQPETQPELQPEHPIQQPALATPTILRLRAAPTGGTGGFSNASSAARIKMVQPTYQYDRGEQGECQKGALDSEKSPVFRLPQQQGQPMFDYDRIKEEINRMSKQSRPSDVLDR